MQTRTLPEEYRPSLPPFLHQREALEMGWDRAGFALLMEMGTGKTRTLIDNACLLHARGLVDAILLVAPKSVYTNWTRWGDPENPGELEKWLWQHQRDGLRICTWRSGRTNRDGAEQLRILDADSPGLRVLAVNAEALNTAAGCLELVKRFLRAHRTIFAVDESTLMKNPKSKVTKTLLGLAPLAPYRRILTGSPTSGSPVDIFPQYEFLGPRQGLLGQRTVHAFRARYCELREMQIGGRRIEKEVGQKNIEELADAIARHGFRKRKDECLDLPPKIYAPRREVEMTDEQKKVYRELKQTAMAEVRGSEVTTQIVVTQLMRMHQVVCGHVRTDDGRVLRLDNRRISAMMDQIAESDEKAIIWCGYTSDVGAVVRALEEEYGEGCAARWYGELPLSEREAEEADFKAGRRRFMVATQQAGARGRTWTEATLVIYYSNSYDLELRQQSEDRAHRIGQERSVVYVDLVCPGTVDELIIKALRAKKDVVSLVLRDGLGAWI